MAGQFYSDSSEALTRDVSQFTETGLKKVRAVSIVSPHAGLVFSGSVAGAVYSRIEFPQTFIILGPNHTGIGMPVSIMSSGEWVMPTGSVQIDSDIAAALRSRERSLSEDSTAHSMEHSLEVQLPFILHFSKDVRIVPIVLMTDSLDICRSLGESIADVIKHAADKSITIIASSDMSHYVSDDVARAKDQEAIDRVLDIDPEGLYETVMKKGISMCGVIPVTTMLFAARKLGATTASLIKYMTSGEVSGDYGYVVGYAGIIVHALSVS